MRRLMVADPRRREAPLAARGCRGWLPQPTESACGIITFVLYTLYGMGGRGTNEFAAWYAALDADEQDALNYSIELLEEYGPALGRPHADTVRDSQFPNMRELRSQASGRPLRTFYAFDPRRSAILLLGGDKTGDARFYERMIARADALYGEYLEDLEREGLI